MKSALFFIVLGLFSINAEAAHWDCKGAHNLQQVSFDLNSSFENFAVVAPDLDQKGLQLAFEPINAFTLAAYQLIDTKAQETIDYTLIIDRDAKSVSVFSQWSTNENVDVEKLVCIVNEND